MTKKELRIKYKAKRLALSENEKMKLDDLLLIQFQKLSFENVQTLLSYEPMPHTAEPQTHLFSRYLQHLIPNLKWLIQKQILPIIPCKPLPLMKTLNLG